MLGYNNPTLAALRVLLACAFCCVLCVDIEYRGSVYARINYYNERCGGVAISSLIWMLARPVIQAYDT